ncbi:MAG: oligosaccharide flippase family protein [Ferruginibacter sp.]|nr:oligosaccharide flippase family protein [Bacteroidota bacterium]MBX2917937.1 oligosaccharide flippase family protein [Ferruginibacter sp.]MCB0709187.1 oligosaccharide flippase family protein [Chitinophagaceae bacterium]MCC7377946.1 oligosaccharide flippase family protein [Chitinophagaceae bacterium]
MSLNNQLGSLWQWLLNFFTKGHPRSLEAKKNIMVSLFIKGASIAIGLILVPLTIHYVNPSQYGIWVTLSSMVAWISFFDIGFTHGLRNRFAEAKANGNKELARTYISTTYYYIGIIFIVLWILLIIVTQFINWYKLLNVPASMEKELTVLVMLIFSYFCLQFIFRIINTILIADQKSAKASLIDMLGQLFSLLIIFILTKTTRGSLLYLALAIGIAPTLILILSNFFFFNTAYKEYKPSLSYVKKRYAKDIMSLGMRFFVLQIAAIIQFESILFLIAHYFKPEQVTPYSIAYKYFFTLQMIFTILLSPLWSGVTDAYNSGDMDWIKNAIKKYLIILAPFILLGAIMLAVSGVVYDIWVGKEVVYVKFSLSLLCYIYFSVTMFASIFVSVINGIGALRIQFFSSLVTPVLFLSLSIILIKQFHFGVESILLSSIVSNVFGYIIAPVQVYNIFYKKSEARIWYR